MIRTALKEVFFEKKSFLWAALVSIFFFFLYVYPPIFFTPSNSFSFFIKSTPLWAFVLLIALCVFMGILTAMHIFLWTKRRSVKAKTITAAVGASASSIMAGLFSSATCITCVSTVFSFILPPAGIIFLFDYRWWITGAGTILVLMSIFTTSNHIVKGCTTCSVSKTRTDETTNQRRQAGAPYNKTKTSLL